MFNRNIQSPVLIVGMHRSGTSMVAKAFNEAGIFMGAMRDHNGEVLYGIDLNERILEKSGGSWHNPPSPEALALTIPSFEKNLEPVHLYGAHLKHPSGRALRLKSIYSGPWGVKDPRLCFTLPWWLEKFPKAKVIWVLRDEDEIVSSLMRRQVKLDEAQSELSKAEALELARLYNESAALAIRTSGVAHRAVQYEDLVHEDMDIQRKTWFSLYQFLKVSPGKLTGFERKTPRITRVKAKKEHEISYPTHGPLVSVIVPNYNHEPYLVERISSILNQTYTNIEVLLMDDCSTDKSQYVLQEYEVQDDRVRCLFNEENSGSPFAQWERGAALAKGKYLWIAESDDSCDLDMLAAHVAALEKNANAVLAYSHSHLVNEQGEFLRDYRDDYAFIFGDTSRWKRDFTADGPTEVRSTLVFSNTVPNASGALFRKEAFDRVGAPKVSWKLNGDWMFYAELLQQGDLVFHSRPRNKFRLHEKTQRKRAIASYTAFDELLALHDVFENKGWTGAGTLQSARAQVAMWWAANVFSMKFNADTFKNNIRLYRTFSKYKSGLLWYLIRSATLKLAAAFFIALGLKKPIKKLAAKLFPKTFFAH